MGQGAEDGLPVDILFSAVDGSSFNVKQLSCRSVCWVQTPSVVRSSISGRRMYSTVLGEYGELIICRLYNTDDICERVVMLGRESSVGDYRVVTGRAGCRPDPGESPPSSL